MNCTGMPARLAIAVIAAVLPRTAICEEESPRWLVPTLHSATLLLGMRVGASTLWPEAYDLTDVDSNWQAFKTGFQRAPAWNPDAAAFEWDGDPWPINALGHAAMGSELYLRHREAHHPWWSALGMTVLWSFAWEYLVEGWHKQPSGIDLLWTPLGGALLGELRYRLYLEVRAMQESAGRHVLLYLLDPLAQAERDLFGLDY